jgi:hypothetical protein
MIVYEMQANVVNATATVMQRADLRSLSNATMNWM